MTTMPMTFDAALIDLDGTLVHSLPDLAAAANLLLQDLNQAPMPDDMLAGFVGKGSRDMLRRMLEARSPAPAPPPDDARLDALVAQFFRHYRRINGQRSVVYPGVIEGLQAFQKAGVRLAVVTNKAFEFAEQLLAHTGLAEYFDLIVAGDSCSHKKPHPAPLLHACHYLDVAPERALMIGDSINDAQAARSAGVPVVLVPYGYNHGHDVQGLDVDGIVSSIEDAVRWAASAQPNHPAPP